jgi:hypothetical protein
VHLPLQNRIRVFLRALGKPESGFAAQSKVKTLNALNQRNEGHSFLED